MIPSPELVAEVAEALGEAGRDALLRAPKFSSFWVHKGETRRPFITEKLADFRSGERMYLNDKGRAVRDYLNGEKS